MNFGVVFWKMVLLKPISELRSLSIKLESFSEFYKTAKLKSLFKKGSKTKPSNYSPILQLPSISKIIEKRIHEQATGSFYLTIKFDATINQDFEKTTW